MIKTLIAVLLLTCPAVLAAEKPNILFILVSDLGKEWISCYGGEGIQTPNVDKLAADGMKFDNAYGTPQSTPSRVTLMTGQYPYRHGWVSHWDVPRWGGGAHFDPSMNPCYPLALRAAGYKTCAAGEWQLDDFRVEPRALDEAGFDEWCMWTGVETGNKPSEKLYQDPYINTNGTSKTHTGAYGPDVHCDFLIDFMRRHKDEPMFLYYPMTLAQTPFSPTPDEPGVKGRESVPAMVRYMDKQVGRLVAAIDELGLDDKTYIIFATANGTHGHGNRRLGREVKAPNGRLGESGSALPFIVVGPTIKTGTVTDALIDFTDIAPTFCELAGTKMPGNDTIDGQSFAPLLQGKANDSPREWVLSMGGGEARLKEGRIVPQLEFADREIRTKRFKARFNRQRVLLALYDMQADPWETTTLITSQDPEVRAANKRFEEIVKPMPAQDAAPRYKPNPPQAWDKR